MGLYLDWNAQCGLADCTKGRVGGICIQRVSKSSPVCLALRLNGCDLRCELVMGVTRCVGGVSLARQSISQSEWFFSSPLREAPWRSCQRSREEWWDEWSVCAHSDGHGTVQSLPEKFDCRCYGCAPTLTGGAARNIAVDVHINSSGYGAPPLLNSHAPAWLCLKSH